MKKLLMIVMSIIFIIIGIVLFIKGNELKQRCTSQTVGTVVNIKEEVSHDEDGTTYTYYPVIEYKAGEKTITKQSLSGSGNSKYNINDKVSVLYNPNNIEEFIIEGENTMSIIAIVFIVIGIITLLVGIRQILIG